MPSRATGGFDARTRNAALRRVEPKIRSSPSRTRARSPAYTAPATARYHHRSWPRREAARHSACFTAPPRKQGVTSWTRKIARSIQLGLTGFSNSIPRPCACHHTWIQDTAAPPFVEPSDRLGGKPESLVIVGQLYRSQSHRTDQGTPEPTCSEPKRPEKLYVTIPPAIRAIRSTPHTRPASPSRNHTRTSGCSPTHGRAGRGRRERRWDRR